MFEQELRPALAAASVVLLDYDALADGQRDDLRDDFAEHVFPVLTPLSVDAAHPIGRFLEHARIFCFHNGGDEEFDIGSADWMTRHLDRRVEAVSPVEDPALCGELREILNLMLDDNRQAWDLRSDGRYVQRVPAEGEAERASQMLLMERTLARAQ